MRALTAALIVVAAFLVLPAGALANFDLEVTLTQDQNPAPEEGEHLFQATVTNHGPDAATDASLEIGAPAGLYDYSSDQTTQGTTSHVNRTVTFDFGSIASGASATGKGYFISSHPGGGAASADVESVGTESSDANNHATLPTQVIGLTAPNADAGAVPLGIAGPAIEVPITNHSLNTTTVSLQDATGDVIDWFGGTRCAGPLDVDQTCVIKFRFFPSALGPHPLHLTYRGTALVDDTTFDLTGTGIPFPTIAGPTGPAGPAGPPSFKLVVAPVSSKLRGKAGSPVTFSYVSTLDAQATLDVLKGSKRVARITGGAKTGTNKLRWNGKVGQKTAPAGKYKLRLTAVNGTQTATAKAKLTLSGR